MGYEKGVYCFRYFVKAVKELNVNSSKASFDVDSNEMSPFDVTNNTVHYI